LNIVLKLLSEYNIPRISTKELTFLNKKLGQGSQSKVYMCDFKGTKIAFKLVVEIDLKCLIHEIAIISKINHSNIPKFYGVIAEENAIGYATEFIDGSTLDELKLDTYSFEEKVDIIKKIASVIEYMHDNNVIHRDLKAENIMVNKNNKNVYLIDFGISKILGSNTSCITRGKGTINYLAPEILDVSEVNENNQIISKINKEIDVWAFGCLVSYIFSGVIPWENKFPDRNNTKIQKAIFKKVPFPIPDNITHNLIITIIKECTVIDTKVRKTMKEINLILK